MHFSACPLPLHREGPESDLRPFSFAPASFPLDGEAREWRIVSLALPSVSRVDRRMILPPRSTVLTTPRLRLRPSDAADAARAFEIRSDPAVSRMLSRARFPPDPDETAAWFDDHPREWTEGLAFRFAIERERRMIGLVDLDDVSMDGQEAEIGIWLEQADWGNGYAGEAARAILDWAFGPLGLTRVRAGHAEDNAASARLIASLGFRRVGEVVVPSRSRGEDVLQHRYDLHRP
jgi:RimJ/RimL family protein N-acetyltransferase